MKWGIYLEEKEKVTKAEKLPLMKGAWFPREIPLLSLFYLIGFRLLTFLVSSHSPLRCMGLLGSEDLTIFVHVIMVFGAPDFYVLKTDNSHLLSSSSFSSLTYTCFSSCNKWKYLIGHHQTLVKFLFLNHKLARDLEPCYWEDLTLLNLLSPVSCSHDLIHATCYLPP